MLKILQQEATSFLRDRPRLLPAYQEITLHPQKV
jgi:hypothetical protein